MAESKTVDELLQLGDDWAKEGAGGAEFSDEALAAIRDQYRELAERVSANPDLWERWKSGFETSMVTLGREAAAAATGSQIEVADLGTGFSAAAGDCPAC